MPDPLINEDFLAEKLSQPATTKNVEELQGAVFMTLLAMYDRKVDRMEFARVSSQCMSIYAMLSRLWILGSMEGLYNEGTLTDASFKKAINEMISMSTEFKQDLITMVEMLKQCPTSQDKVH